MKVELTEIGRVIPYARNPRKNDAAIAKVAASIKEYGFRQPIVVDEEMVIIAGHTRLQAAQSLGLKKVPVHVATGLTQAQIISTLKEMIREPPTGAVMRSSPPFLTTHRLMALSKHPSASLAPAR